MLFFLWLKMILKILCKTVVSYLIWSFTYVTSMLTNAIKSRYNRRRLWWSLGNNGPCPRVLAALLDIYFFLILDIVGFAFNFNWPVCLSPLRSVIMRFYCVHVEKKTISYTYAWVIANCLSLPKDLAPYLPSVIPGLKQCLLDPVPEVRSVSARALGAMVRGMGENIFQDLLPWLMEKLVSEQSSVDRSGAAQGKEQRPWVFFNLILVFFVFFLCQGQNMVSRSSWNSPR